MLDVGPGIAALAGASIGFVGALAGAWIKESFETSRSLTKLAIELASKDYEIKAKETDGRAEGGELPPIGAFYHYYNNLLQSIANGTCDAKFIVSNSRKHAEIEEAFRLAKAEFENRVSLRASKTTSIILPG